MLPWSVMPSAGCPSATAAATTSPILDAPSSMENSLCWCRWVKLAPTTLVLPNDRAVIPGDSSAPGPPDRRPGALQVGPRPLGGVARRLGTALLGGDHARRQASLLGELLDLLAGGHLLGEQGGLDPGEETLQPADELTLGHPQHGVGGVLLVEGQGVAAQLVTQLVGEPRPPAR